MAKFRFIAPSGTSIKLFELVKWIGSFASRKDPRTELIESIRIKYGVKHCFLMSSARAAMAMLFGMLKDLNRKHPNRNEIIMPSYTCYSVAAAAEIAGLKIRICDIDPQTLSYDLNILTGMDFTNVLAIISANLYGYPDDMKALESIARNNRVFLIDDAAQSMNAKIGEQYSGTFGDIGLFSLDKGKNITTIQGGVIVTNNSKLAEMIKSNIEQLPYPTFVQRLSESIKLVIYSFFLHPRLYWIFTKLTVLGLGKTIYTTDYLFTQYSRHLGAIGSSLFSRIDSITELRTRNAELIKKKISDSNNISLVTPTPNSTPCNLRLPVLVKDRQKRDTLIEKLNNLGIGATLSYPQSLALLDETKAFTTIENGLIENGKFISEHIVTLPTLSYLTENDINHIADSINAI